jgi:hypothetical protein
LVSVVNEAISKSMSDDKSINTWSLIDIFPTNITICKSYLSTYYSIFL